MDVGIGTDVARTAEPPRDVTLPRARALTRADAAAAGLSFTSVVVLAFADGGYWPSAWAWCAVAFWWLASLTLIVRREVRVSRAAVVVLVAAGALVVWTLASTTWSLSVGRSVYEAERTFAYLAALTALFVVVRPRSVAALLGGAWAATTLVCAYAVSTRLFPERLGVFDPNAGYRLSEPIGYSNALGLFAALGALLALALAARARTLAVRAAGAASLVILLPALYFTFSRGAWAALAVGAAAAVAIDPRRLQLVTTAFAASAGPIVALAVAWNSDALTTSLDAPIAEAAQQGERLAVFVAAGGILNAALVVVATLVARGVAVPAVAARAYAAVLVLLTLVALGAGLARYGDPVSVADRAYETFTAPSPPESSDLNERLFTFTGSGRGDKWRVAWDRWRDDPWFGSGGGTYEIHWHRDRIERLKVRDAHSLYLEFATELGVVGLAVLLTVLLVPVAVGLRARRTPLVPLALGAYVAYLVHAGIDWDWELPAVTLAGLFCGGGALVAASSDGARHLGVRGRRLAVGTAAAALASVALVAGNVATDGSRVAAQAGDWDRAAADARRASRWVPWAAGPWQLLGEAEVARGRQDSARSAFSTAAAKDGSNWETWYRLALVSTGAARVDAARRAIALNPRGPELLQLRRELGRQR